MSEVEEEESTEIATEDKGKKIKTGRKRSVQEARKIKNSEGKEKESVTEVADGLQETGGMEIENGEAKTKEQAVGPAVGKH